MKWAQLPVAGGIYDQDPRLIDAFEIIFAEINKKAAADERRQKQESDQMKNKSRRNR